MNNAHRDLFEQAPATLYLLDRDLVVVALSAGAAAQTPKREVLGKPVSVLLPGAQTLAMDALNRALNGEIAEAALRDGAGRLLAAPWRDGDTEIVGAVIGLERPDADARMHRSVIETLFEKASVLAFLFDDQKKLLRMSARAQSFFNFTARAGQTLQDFMPWRPDHWADGLDRALRGEVAVRFEDDLLSPQGFHCFLNWDMRPWRDEAGVVRGVLFTLQDVTETVTSRKAEKKAEERLLVALEAAHAVIWEVDYRSGLVEWQGDPVAVFGRTLSMDDFWVDRSQLFFKEDAEQLSQYSRWLAERPNCDFAHRIRKADGGEGWINVVARSYFNRGGKLRRAIFMATDISAKMRGETAPLAS